MIPKIVELNIVDNDDTFANPLLGKYYLINPDKGKLGELKHLIESRFDYYGLTDDEIKTKEEFCNNIWNFIENFIAENFVVLNIDETYEISY